MATILNIDRFLRARAANDCSIEDFAAHVWCGDARRVHGIGKDALEITAFDGLINIEAIAGTDGCEAMLTIEHAREARAALDAAIAEAERRAGSKVTKFVPSNPGGSAA